MTTEPVRSLDEALKRIRARDADLRELGVASLQIFGSLARDDAEPQSDVDVLVEFTGPATFDGFMDVKFLLEDALGRPVDLVTRAALRPELTAIVQREAVRAA